MKIISTFLCKRVLSEQEQALLKMDFSPLDYNLATEKVARRVNETIGLRDGGNVNISLGCVLYPSEQDARRQKILKNKAGFYLDRVNER